MQRRFTLVEMLVVLVIILVMIGIALGFVNVLSWIGTTMLGAVNTRLTIWMMRCLAMWPLCGVCRSTLQA